MSDRLQGTVTQKHASLPRASKPAFTIDIRFACSGAYLYQPTSLNDKHPCKQRALGSPMLTPSLPGRPYIHSQCQSHLLVGPLGIRITFHNADVVTHLTTLSPTRPPYAFVVLAHCIWYFDTPAELSRIVATLASHATRLCLVECSLRASQSEQLPYVITALLLATIKAKCKVPSLYNIRTILTPAQIKQNVHELRKFNLVSGLTAISGGNHNGRLEAGYLLDQREKLLQEIRQDEVSEKEVAATVAIFGSLQAGVDRLG